MCCDPYVIKRDHLAFSAQPCFDFLQRFQRFRWSHQGLLFRLCLKRPLILNNAALWFYQPYFKFSGLPIAWFGVAFASYQVFTAICSMQAHLVEKRLGEKYALISLVFFVGTGYFLMAQFVFVFSFIFAYFHQFARGFSRIVLTDYVNKLTDSDRRATVLSVQNLIMRLFYAMLIPFAGKIADTAGIVDALNILGFATLLIGGVLLVLMRKVLSGHPAAAVDGKSEQPVTAAPDG